MRRIHLRDKEFELFITEAEIQAAVERMARQIAVDMAGKRPLFVGILNGAFLSGDDLGRASCGDYE